MTGAVLVLGPLPRRGLYIPTYGHVICNVFLLGRFSPHPINIKLVHKTGFSQWMWVHDIYTPSEQKLWESLCGSVPVQPHSRVWLFATPWTAARQASLSITNSWSLLKLMSIESVMASNHLILCRPLLLLPSLFPNLRVFSNESVLRIRQLKYWSFSFSISPSSEYSGLISFRIDWFDLAV